MQRSLFQFFLIFKILLDELVVKIQISDSLSQYK